MKFIKQFSIILLITFLGELLHILIPLPIPASVYGLVLMLIALRSGLVKVEHVKETAVFLIEIMPVMFIPAGAGLLESWGVLQPIWLPVCIITVATTGAWPKKENNPNVPLQPDEIAEVPFRGI